MVKLSKTGNEGFMPELKKFKGEREPIGPSTKGISENFLNVVEMAPFWVLSPGQKVADVKK